MEKEGLDRSSKRAGRTIWPRLGIVRAASALALVLLISGSGAAHADNAACHAPQAVFSVPVKLDGIAARLRRHEPVRILAIGSSSTQGGGATSPSFAYPAQL